jgi:hypothetical protein
MDMMAFAPRAMMKQLCHKQTVTNMLTDPMVRSVMDADRVDPQELAVMLAAVAKTLKPSPRRLSAWTPRFVCTN